MSRTRPRRRDDVVWAAFRGAVLAGRALPLGLLRPAGACLGRVAIALGRRDRERALAHLEVAFPSLDDAARLRLARRASVHLGRTFAEVVWMFHAALDRIEALCMLDGLHHLTDALQGGNGAVLVTGHCGNWELLNARLGIAGVPLTIAVREVYDPRFDHVATALRSRFGAEVVHRGVNAGRQLAGALAANRVAGLLIDQDIRDVPGVFVPFFGRAAWTPSGAAALALRRHRAVVPAFVERLEDGRHRAVVHPPLDMPEGLAASEAIVDLTARATAAIEAQIRRVPDQWVWHHRRWRTRPGQEAAG